MMRKKNFLMEFTAYDSNGKILKSGKMRVKNSMTEFEAKARFENHLSKKVSGFSKLIIHSCKEDILGSFLDDVFGGSNPFKS